MKILTHIAVIPCLSMAICASALAARFPTDISGAYTCVGHDAHQGSFEEQVDIRLDPAQLAGNAHGYRAIARVDGNTAYVGEVITSGRTVSLDFISTSDATDHGTAIGNLEVRSPISLTYFETHGAESSSGAEKCKRTGD
jgi:hypothetical protein